jgi:hypothetical protein
MVLAVVASVNNYVNNKNERDATLFYAVYGHKIAALFAPQDQICDDRIRDIAVVSCRIPTSS